MDSSSLPGHTDSRNRLNVGPPAPRPGPMGAPSYMWSCGSPARRAWSGGSPRRPAAGSTPSRAPPPSSPCSFLQNCNTNSPFHRPPPGGTTNWSVQNIRITASKSCEEKATYTLELFPRPFFFFFFSGSSFVSSAGDDQSMNSL